MDTSTGVLFGLVALIGANQLIMRTSWARDQDWVFWSVTIGNIVVGGGVLVFGLPGFMHAPAVSWVVGLLLVAHSAQNLFLRAQWRQAEFAEARAEREAERRRMRDERDAREEAEDARPAEP